MIFKIFILQTFCKNMSLIADIFASPFNIVSVWDYKDHTGLKVVLKTDEIHDNTTKEEVYILSKKYLNDIIDQYKNYYISGQQMKESSYRLYVGIVEDGDLYEKHIYSCAYNNITGKMCLENKFDDNFEIEGDFYVGINVSTYTWDQYGSEDEDEDEEPTPPKRAISETECIVCCEKQPDILYTECLHRVVCISCDTKGEFKRCPMCRTRINNNRIKI